MNVALLETQRTENMLCASVATLQKTPAVLLKNHVCAFFALKKCFICNDWQLESQAPPPWPTPLGYMKCWSLGPCSSLANQLWVLQSHWLPWGMLLEALCSVEPKKKKKNQSRLSPFSFLSMLLSLWIHCYSELEKKKIQTRVLFFWSTKISSTPLTFASFKYQSHCAHGWCFHGKKNNKKTARATRIQ